MAAKHKSPPAKVVFIESMECLAVATLPDGPGWTYEIKLDGYRLEAVKQSGETTLYSRRGNVLNRQFQPIADALKKLPDSTNSHEGPAGDGRGLLISGYPPRNSTLWRVRNWPPATHASTSPTYSP